MSNKYQTGQSSIEIIILSLVLVPLFLIVPILGKYMDMAQTTSIASRYVAFEGAAHHGASHSGWKSDSDLATEVRRRFYSQHSLSIKTNDVVSEIDADRNPLWVDHRGDPLLADFNQVSVNTRKQSIDSIFNGLTSLFDFSDDFELDNDNLYRGEVNVQLANIEGLTPFDNLNLSIRRHTVVLADPWASKQAAEVKNKVRDAGLTFPHQVLNVPASLLKPAIDLFEVNASAPEIGKVEPDYVPSDRLK